MSSLDHQRSVTSQLLQHLSSAGFALAGSGAIREHGIIDRPTHDIDLFTTMSFRESFNPAVDLAIDLLRASGYVVTVERRVDLFTSLSVIGDGQPPLIVDFGVDWRGFDPEILEVGPTLDVRDAVGNKVCALFSRGEARDFLDFDAVRASNKFNDEQLLDLASRRDLGFDLGMFVQRLNAVRGISVEDVTEYSCDATSLANIQERLAVLAEELESGAAESEVTIAIVDPSIQGHSYGPQMFL